MSSPLELRYVEVSVKTLHGYAPRIAARFAARVVEDRTSWGGSGPTVDDALLDLAHGTISALPPWARAGYEIEVLVLGAGPATSGRGGTIGQAIEDAAVRRRRREWEEVI